MKTVYDTEASILGIKTKKQAIIVMALELREIRLLLQKYIEGKGY